MYLQRHKTGASSRTRLHPKNFDGIMNDDKMIDDNNMIHDNMIIFYLMCAGGMLLALQSFWATFVDAFVSCMDGCGRIFIAWNDFIALVRNRGHGTSDDTVGSSQAATSTKVLKNNCQGLRKRNVSVGSGQTPTLSEKSTVSEDDHMELGTIGRHGKQPVPDVFFQFSGGTVHDFLISHDG